MTQSAVRRRKPPEERRAEILGTASALASAEGLESLTLRRVADELGVYPGLVSHYFQTVDELVVAAFRHAVSTESAECYAAAAEGPTPLDRLRALLASLIGHERDGVSLLWLDAWSAFRHRAGLAAEVNRQMAVDKQRLGDLIADGVAEGQFHTARPDGLGGPDLRRGRRVGGAGRGRPRRRLHRRPRPGLHERGARAGGGGGRAAPVADPARRAQSVVGPAKAASVRVKP